MIQIYDPNTHQVREATQADVDWAVSFQSKLLDAVGKSVDPAVAAAYGAWKGQTAVPTQDELYAIAERRFADGRHK